MTISKVYRYETVGSHATITKIYRHETVESQILVDILDFLWLNQMWSSLKYMWALWRNDRASESRLEGSGYESYQSHGMFFLQQENLPQPFHPTQV